MRYFSIAQCIKYSCLIGILALALTTSKSTAQQFYDPISLTFGISTSHYKSDSLDTRSHFAPSVGLQLKNNIRKNWGYMFNARFTTRGFVSDEYNSKLKNRYLDIEAGLHRKILNGLDIEAGVSAHHLYRTFLMYSSPGNLLQDQRNTETGFSSHLDGYIGLSMRMEENLGLGFRHFLGSGNTKRNSMEFYIVFNFGKGPIAPSERIMLRENAKTQIHALDKGVMLVRLYTLEKSIDALKQKNMPLKAEELRKRVETQHKELMQAFDLHFDFCKVYFFYSSDTQKVLKSNYEGVIYDTKGNLVENFNPGNNYFFAENGPYPNDESPAGYDYELARSEQGVKVQKVPYFDPYHNFGVFCIRDKNMQALKKPFPFYVKTYGDFIYYRNANSFVPILNNKLHKFLAKN